MPRPPRNLRFARPWVEPVDPPQSPTLRQKSRHLMQPPTTSYPHGYSGNQHRSSTCVKYHFLLPIPGWAVKTCHCTRHTEHYSATNHPRGRILRVSYPGIPGTRPYPFTIDPPRLILDPASTNRRSGDGRPFLGHVATATSTALNRTSLLRHPWSPCLLLTL
jgi:hypothetical protein